MTQYRITKYNPALRDEKGAYPRDEWTCFSEIGKTFKGKFFTKKDYLKVEAAYIDAALKLIEADGASGLRACDIEELIKGTRKPDEQEMLPLPGLRSVCQAVLRNRYWCRLEDEGRFIHFGWDYYLYVGVKTPCEMAVSKARECGLFVELFDSPYSKTGNEHGVV